MTTVDPVLVPLAVVLIGALGVPVGSFLNVVIYRVPLGMSIVHPRSACPSCHTQLSSLDNIPLISWLVLRGRCRYCKAPISVRYPLTEAGTGLLWAAITWWTLTHPGMQWLLSLLLILSAACMALWQIDVAHQRLPNAIVYWLYPLTVIGLVVASLGSGQWPVLSVVGSAGVWFAVFLILYLATGGRGMGLGDVKLAPVLGATLGWIGWGPSLTGLLGAFVIGGFVGVALLVSGRAKRGTAIPFGPFMIASSLVGLVVGTAVGLWYLTLAGI